MVVDGENEDEVDAVLDSRLRNGFLPYLVKWTGFREPTWGPVENVYKFGPLKSTCTINSTLGLRSAAYYAQPRPSFHLEV